MEDGFEGGGDLTGDMKDREDPEGDEKDSGDELEDKMDNVDDAKEEIDQEVGVVILIQSEAFVHNFEICHLKLWIVYFSM